MPIATAGVAASATAAMAVSSIPFSVVADLDLVRCLLLAVWTVNDCLFNR